jgi:hypothetical protein
VIRCPRQKGLWQLHRPLLVANALNDTVQGAVGKDEHFVFLHHLLSVDGDTDTIRPDRGAVPTALVRPVSAKRRIEGWRRARATLCPEANPQCKDASRQ